MHLTIHRVNGHGRLMGKSNILVVNSERGNNRYDNRTDNQQNQNNRTYHSHFTAANSSQRVFPKADRRTYNRFHRTSVGSNRFKLGSIDMAVCTVSGLGHINDRLKRSLLFNTEKSHRLYSFPPVSLTRGSIRPYKISTTRFASTRKAP